MKIRKPAQNWSPVARSLHWLMAFLIVIQLVVGWAGERMARSPAKIDVMTAHKSLGITLLLLVLFRLAWRWFHPASGTPPGSKAWERVLSGLSHGTLYFLMIALPLSGWLAASTTAVPWKLWWFIPWPRIAEPDKALHEQVAFSHEVLAWLLIGILSIHIAAALRHHFIKRNDVLSRMWRGG